MRNNHLPIPTPTSTGDEKQPNVEQEGRLSDKRLLALSQFLFLCVVFSTAFNLLSNADWGVNGLFVGVNGLFVGRARGRTIATTTTSRRSRARLTAKKRGGNVTQSNEEGTQVTPHYYYPPEGQPVVKIGVNGYNKYWLVASEVLNVAVTIVPKAMCSSIREVFHHIEAIHTHHLCRRRCGEARARSAIKSWDLSKMTRVIIFRDPLERAYSAYMNSNINTWIETPNCTTADNCTFERWVSNLLDMQDLAYRNEHFKLQKTIAQFDKIHYNYRLRMSSPIDQKFFWNTLVNRTAPHENASSGGYKSKELAARDLFQKIGIEVLDMLAEKYHDDMELWKEMLEEGTPRQEDEITLYDIYMEEKGKERL